MRRIKPRRLKKENLTAYVLGNKKQRTRMRRDEEPLARLPVSNMKAFPRDDPPLGPLAFPEPTFGGKMPSH